MAPLVDLRPTYGSLFLGVLASVGLMGITTLQTWVYWTKYSANDGFRIKLMVAIIWTLECLRTCFGVHAVNNYVVIEWGNPSALTVSIWSVDINLVMTAFIQIMSILMSLSEPGELVHGWETIVFLSFGNWAMTIALYGATISAKFFSGIQPGPAEPYLSKSSIALPSAIAADMSITVFQLHCLNRYRSDESPSLSIINRLMFYAVNVGVIMTLGDIAVLILSLDDTKGLQYFAVYEVVGNLYANSLLATLNARDSVRKLRPGFRMSSFDAASVAGYPVWLTLPRTLVKCGESYLSAGAPQPCLRSSVIYCQ
ncbi:hypothetical protein JB92DRAFT_82295 [Gautieria morchelliformis]|nr:hypothetical protein JB92DRAFT_1078626 [Gautieria morchelliformis]KAF8515194.1 hypothetical protein JB92DRAFT_82295 [Gautieria morchelliformis]